MNDFRRAPKPGLERRAQQPYRIKTLRNANELAKAGQALRRQIAKEYGRPDVPSVVRHAVRAYAVEHKVSLPAALDALIAEASSFEALKLKCQNAQSTLQQKNDRLRDRKRSRLPEPQGAIYTVKHFFQGGAPGLGGVRKSKKFK